MSYDLKRLTSGQLWCREPGLHIAYLDITRTYVRIKTSAPAGYKLWWVVAVEGGDRS